MGEPHVVTLRATRAGDLDELFDARHDPVAMQMAGFTTDDCADRTAFEERWKRLITDPSARVCTVRADGRVVGDVAIRRDVEGWLVDAWISRAHWGHGIATRALRLLLDDLEARPVHVKVAADNARAIAVLDGLGFRRIGLDLAFADARGVETEQLLYVLR
ncbi:GNAT family N-acetyltransferase [Agromyces subbeticus]|uniref:GNAT family N-acetyltransferase n=1 Tax=Agromyces subbeticus TaxID=293890 RepID=UPI0003B5FAAA|nr:GNAT family N-acetyltransferase [Agromyces subbeticus]